MFIKVNAPAYTDGYYEQLLVTDCLQYARYDSILAPGHSFETAIFHCPKCGTERDNPEHAEVYRCDCGLNYQAYGNALYIWPDRDRGG